MVNTELRILRVFGPTAAEVSAVLRQARADGCPGLRLLERDGEFAVCVQVSAPNRAMAEQYCEKWVRKDPDRPAPQNRRRQPRRR